MRYYEPYEKKKKRPAPRRRRRRRGSCLSRLIRWLIGRLIVLILLAALILYAVPVSFFNTNRQTPSGARLPARPMQILLLGADILNDNSQRTDTVMIASVDYGSASLASILRDTQVSIPGHDKARINAAYAYGGAELAMETVNRNFDLNIEYYITADFSAVVQLVDALGGVDISISEDEMREINNNVYGVRKIFQPLGYTCDELKTYGENIHLNGLQALGYARIRKIDSDFMRASRQRTLMQAMLKQARANIWKPWIAIPTAKAVYEALDTNIPLWMLISLGEKALFTDEIRQLRLPVNGSYNDTGTVIKITDIQANIDAYRQFAYGE